MPDTHCDAELLKSGEQVLADIDWFASVGALDLLLEADDLFLEAFDFFSSHDDG